MNISTVIPMRHPYLFVGCLIASCATASFSSARPVPQNLANGLDKLVENNLIQKGVITAAPTVQGNASLSRTKSGTKTSTTTSAQAFDAYRTSVARVANTYSARAIAQSITG